MKNIMYGLFLFCGMVTGQIFGEDDPWAEWKEIKPTVEKIAVGVVSLGLAKGCLNYFSEQKKLEKDHEAKLKELKKLEEEKLLNDKKVRESKGFFSNLFKSNAVLATDAGIALDKKISMAHKEITDLEKRIFEGAKYFLEGVKSAAVSRPAKIGYGCGIGFYGTSYFISGYTTASEPRD